MRKKEKTAGEKDKIRPKKFKIAIAFFLVLALLFSFLFYFLQPKTARLAAECAQDSDCVKVQTSCCPCEMGGEERCVARSEAESWREKLQNCSGIFCIALYNCKISGCKCEEGKCTEIK